MMVTASSACISTVKCANVAAKWQCVTDKHEYLYRACVRICRLCSIANILAAGVGSINNTFGIKGVQENTFFFKSITDASKLRRQVSECFERAALPNTSPQVGGLDA